MELYFLKTIQKKQFMKMLITDDNKKKQNANNMHYSRVSPKIRLSIFFSCMSIDKNYRTIHFKTVPQLNHKSSKWMVKILKCQNYIYRRHEYISYLFV